MLLRFIDGLGTGKSNQVNRKDANRIPKSVLRTSQLKQASRPILVRGLRQDLREYFYHLNVKVSVAQLVEYRTRE